MNLKDFSSVTALLPVRYLDEKGVEVMAKASVQADRHGQVSITIPGGKHANAFIEMILLQVLTGLTLNQQEPQAGFPGHNVEVAMDPPQIDGNPEEEIPDAELCGRHQPVQHRDGMEPWCPICGRNKDYNSPRKIQFGNRPPQIGESFRRYQDGLLNEGP